MDVFISWTSADREVKNALVAHFREAGVKCRDAEEVVASDASLAYINAVRQCKVFIVVVSDAAMKDTYVINEITAARDMEKEGKLNIVVYKVTDTPYTDRFAFLLGHIACIDGTTSPLQDNTNGESAMDTLVCRVKSLL